MKSALRGSAFLLLGFLTVGGLVGMLPLVAGSGPGARASGDVNCDGATTLADIEAYARALVDPSSWTTTYGRPLSDLLARADFTGDGQLSAADTTPFCNAVRRAISPVGAAGAQSASSGESGVGDNPTGGVDLDIDSDNTNGPNCPGRTTEEDAIEATSNQPGKFIVRNDDDDNSNSTADKDETAVVAGENDLVPAALELQPGPNVTPVTHGLAYYITYPASVRIWVCDADGAPTAVYASGTIAAQRVWVHGDMNGDRVFDFDDIDAFVLAVTNFPSYKTTYLNGYTDMLPRAADIGDFDHDRRITFDDVDPFIAAIGQDDSYVPVYYLVEGISTSSGGTPTSLTAYAETSTHPSRRSRRQDR